MREMDLILGGFMDTHGDRLDEAEIAAFETLLDRRDQDLYAWIAQRPDAEPADATKDEQALIASIQTHLPA